MLSANVPSNRVFFYMCYCIKSCLTYANIIILAPSELLSATFLSCVHMRLVACSMLGVRPAYQSNPLWQYHLIGGSGTVLPLTLGPVTLQ